MQVVEVQASLTDGNGTVVANRVATGTNQYSYVWSAGPGTYSITAVAFDNFGAATTSAPVIVTINRPPTATTTSPANNTTLSAPANITITCTASDNDGTISKVEFSANNYRIGAGTLTGTNQYSFTWPGIGIGTYILRAVATDNRGATFETGSVTVKVTMPALLVTGSTTLNSSDTNLKARLEAMGYVVTVKDGTTAATADANGKAVVVISSTVTPTTVNTKFRTVAVPVVIWEPGLFFDMGMTVKTSSFFGTATGQTQVKITNPAHPLAAALSGTVTGTSAASTFDWGKPNANAAAVATLVADATKMVIFGYEPGAAMPGLAAPARRVGLFLHDTTGASFDTGGNGARLFDAAVNWASGRASLSGSMAASPAGSVVDLTAEGLMDWAHWGLGGFDKFDHKNGVTPQISNYTWVGSSWIGDRPVNWLADNPTRFSWTDGTPTNSALNTPTGVFTSMAGNGFQITVPADTNLKTLKLHVGLWYAQGKLEATLSDGSAPAYVDSSLANNSGTSNGVYTIRFKAASSGQTLKIKYTAQTDYNPPYGNVTLESATLR